MKKILYCALMSLAVGSVCIAQDLEQSKAVGFRGGLTRYQGDDFASSNFMAGGSMFGEWFFNNSLSLEGAINGGEIGADFGIGDPQLKSQYLGFSSIVRVGIPNEKFRPYVAGGGQLAIYKPNGVVNLIFSLPVGGGVSFQIGENIHLDFRGLYHIVFADNVDKIDNGGNDNWLIGTAGITWILRGNKDKDNDRLITKLEKKHGTDPNNADTDGDGLSDGEEVLDYNTDPLMADSDNDGLQDDAEINRYGTDPNKADSDNDGLSDGAEVNEYKTDPLLADTDNDGLTDAEEIRKYKTSAIVADSDDDGLNDGDEVRIYKTDPTLRDSDGGSVDDGHEVARGSNPLKADDDVVLKIEDGKIIVLEGVVFAINSATITPASEAILQKAVNALNANSDLIVEIRGYTDHTGALEYNQKLSQARAATVKAYLTDQGIAANRLRAKGLGPDNPVASNETPEGREKNRRVEFFVIEGKTSRK